MNLKKAIQNLNENLATSKPRYFTQAENFVLEKVSSVAVEVIEDVRRSLRVYYDAMLVPIVVVGLTRTPLVQGIVFDNARIKRARVEHSECAFFQPVVETSPEELF